MKTQLKLENVSFLLLGIYAFMLTKFSWWWFVGLFFLPDISILGYIINSKIGAIFYNLFHHLGIAIVIYFIGVYYSLPYVTMIGAILFSHSSFDRILGYGLKYSDSFKNTPIGKIGKI